MNATSSKTSADWKKNFDSLPEDHRNALCFLAIHAAPFRKIRIQELCGCMNSPPDPSGGKKPLFSPGYVRRNTWDQNKVKRILDELEKLGWIDFNAEGFPHC